MKVDGSKIGGTLGANRDILDIGEKKSDSASGKKKVNETLLRDSAKLNVSAKGQDYAKINEAVKNVGDVDEAKVAKLQQLIDSGKYNVSAEDIADKMVDEHMMFPL